MVELFKFSRIERLDNYFGSHVMKSFYYVTLFSMVLCDIFSKELNVRIILQNGYMKHFTYHFTKRFDLRYCHGFGESNMNVEICRHHRAQDYQSPRETNSTQNQVRYNQFMIMTKMIRAKLCSIKNGSTLVR